MTTTENDRIEFFTGEMDELPTPRSPLPRPLRMHEARQELIASALMFGSCPRTRLALERWNTEVAGAPAGAS